MDQNAKTNGIGVLLSPLYDVPAAVLDRAVGFGMDADAVVDTMFLVELASEDNAAKTANFEEAASNAKQVIPELLPLRQRWPIREFPKELLPLMPPSDFQGTAARQGRRRRAQGWVHQVDSMGQVCVVLVGIGKRKCEQALPDGVTVEEVEEAVLAAKAV